MYIGPTIILSRVSTLTRDIDIASLSRPSVYPSVRPLRSSILLKRLNALSQFFHRTVAQSFIIYEHQSLHEMPTGLPPAGALNTGGV